MPTSPSAPGAAVAARLDALRGPVPPRSHDARTIAALTVNPGCSRRAVLDAAGVDKRRLAERVGSPARFGQSPFAITRGLMFEKQIKADGCAQLLDLLRSELGFDVPEHEYVDLGVEPADTPGAAGDVAVDRGSRYRRTRELFSRVADGAAVLADHPLLTLEVAGRTAYVEPDVVALRARRTSLGASSAASTPGGGLGLPSDDEPASGRKSQLYIAEVKSFSVIDGQADPTKVGAAATQSAVYVLALRRLFESLGLDPGLVASDVVLVCPKDFSNSPTAHLVDVRRQIAAVGRQLDRLPRIEALVAGLDPAIDFDLSVDQPADKQDAPHPHRSGAELTKSLSMIEARYAPECVTRCELAFHCRAEARAAGSADALGRSVRDALGGVASLDEALALASGDERKQMVAGGVGSVGGVGTVAGAVGDGAVGAEDALPRAGGDEAARLLRAAARAYDEAVAMQPRVPETMGRDFGQQGDSASGARELGVGSGAVVAPRVSDEDAGTEAATAAATVTGAAPGSARGSVAEPALAKAAAAEAVAVPGPARGSVGESASAKVAAAEAVAVPGSAKDSAAVPGPGSAKDSAAVPGSAKDSAAVPSPAKGSAAVPGPGAARTSARAKVPGSVKASATDSAAATSSDVGFDAAAAFGSDAAPGSDSAVPFGFDVGSDSAAPSGSDAAASSDATAATAATASPETRAGS